MKKIICMLAMALLVIGAAQAQEGVGKMVVRMNDGKVKIFRTADIEEVTFKTTATSPSTVEEAKAMLVGYWKCNDHFLDDPEEYTESTYIIVTENFEVLLAFKFADNIPDDKWYAEYAGKIVLSWIFGDDIIIDSEDPTTGYFWREEWSEFERQSLSFKNLQDDSFDAQWEDYMNFEDDYPYNHDIKIDGTFYRVEPFEYIMPSDGLKIK